MTEPVRNINCTQCGAGLDVLGGGRVRVHVCSYCGAELDAQNDYRVLARFRDMQRPKTPFDLGMEGEIFGVPFTVIGTISWIERYGSRTWQWTDHQVYSPTHGYAWLTLEDGHVTFTRKTRDLPDPPFISSATINSAERRPTVRLGDRTFRYYGSGDARPVFIEGEFNYQPTLEDRIRYVSLLCGHEMLDMVESAGEREYELSRLPDRTALLTSFGVSPDRVPWAQGTHALEVVERSATQLFIRNVALAAAFVSLILTAVFWSAGETVLRTDRVAANRDLSIPFEVTLDDRLTQIEIWANVYNSWAWFEAELLDGDGESVAAFERGLEYYLGREGGESWTEGSQRVRTKLLLDPGLYTLELTRTEAEVDWPNGAVANQMQVIISQGVMNPLWMLGASILLGLIGGVFLVDRGLQNRRRWAGSDWSDD